MSKVKAALACVPLLALAAAGCGNDAGKAGETKARPAVEVEVTAEAPSTVKSKRVTITGAVQPATAEVEVEVDGELVDVAHDGSFKVRVSLEPRVNIFQIRATARGSEEDKTSVRIERELTAREIAERREEERQRQIRLAQERERRRQARIARQQQARDQFIAEAQTIDYDQLAKNPDEYRGTKVVYRGQIFQIQEDYGVSVILLSVTDEGYGFWDDNIWVDYNGEIAGAEDDIITVYGVVKGEKSYETQAGGETYVPQIKARYIVE